MDAKSVIKAWKWFTVTLAILNVALCIGIWFRPQKSSPPKRLERPDEFIISKLHFSDEQKSAFEELRDRHHDSIIIIQEEGRKIRTALFENLKSADKTEQQLDSLMAAVGDNQKQIEFVTYRHFRQVRELCNDEQKKIFDNIIQEVLRKMTAPPPRPGGAPPGNAGPDEPPPPGNDGPSGPPPPRP
jgi:protein CpxP